MLFVKNTYICSLFFIGNRRARSSGVEHLPFKQRVGGSSPPALTESPATAGLFYFKEVDLSKVSPDKSGRAF